MAFIPTLLTFCFSQSLGATKWYKGGERGCIECAEAGVFFSTTVPPVEPLSCPAKSR